MDISIKSTGVLIDEFITTDLKIKFIGDKKEFHKRKHLLSLVLLDRITDNTPKELYNLYNKLRRYNLKCWEEQEIVMRYSKLEKITNDDAYFAAEAAVMAQIYNNKRNLVIRQIDLLLGEHENTQLEKSYA